MIENQSIGFSGGEYVKYTMDGNKILKSETPTHGEIYNQVNKDKKKLKDEMMDDIYDYLTRKGY